MKLVPVAKLGPPEAAAYQFKVPPLAAAVNVTVPASQRLAGVVEVIVGVILIVAITAVLGVEQLPELAST